MEYVSRVPRPPLHELIDDLYFLEGAPPYARLTVPPAPSPLLIVNLRAPFLIRAGTDIVTAEYADGSHEFRAFTPNGYVEARRRFLREHPGDVLDSWPLPAD